MPMSDLKVSFDNNNKPHFSVDLTKEQLKAAQAFDLNEKNAAFQEKHAWVEARSHRRTCPTIRIAPRLR